MGRFGSNAAEASGSRRKLEGLEACGDVYRIPLARLEADPEQPRKTFDEDELARLAASLRTDGQLQPIRVRYDEGRDRFVVVAGERRLRAAAIAGLTHLTGTVVDDRDLARLEVQLIENLLRADLSPIEEARAFRELQVQCGYTAKALAERLSLSESKVSRSLALLELPEDKQEAVDAGDIRGAAIRELIREKDRKPRPSKAKKTKAKRDADRLVVFVVDGARVEITFAKKARPPEAVEAALAAAMALERAKRSKPEAEAA
jgi:ParB family chromosome partitioning protein